jgi:hypothetical protein
VTWIYAFPGWLFAILVVFAFAGLSALGVYVARRTCHNERFTHNDVGGPVLTLLGTILAVMLSFLVVAVWQQFDASAARVEKEAAAAADLYRIAAFLPAPVGNEAQHSVRDYLSATIDYEWPAMRAGRGSVHVSNVEGNLYRILARADRNDARYDELVRGAFADVNTMMDSRRARLHDNETGLPAMLWLLMLFMAAVTIAFSFFLSVQSARAHTYMVMAFSGVIGAMFALIAELDFPFRGDVSIAPTALQHVLAALTNPNVF